MRTCPFCVARMRPYDPGMLNERIRGLRLARGLTLQQIGDAFGISKVSVSSWESGRSNPDHKRLEQLAALLGTTVQYLVSGQHPPGKQAVHGVRFVGWDSVGLDTAQHSDAGWFSQISCSPGPLAFATRYVGSQDIAWQPSNVPSGSVIIVDPSVQPSPGDLVLVRRSDGLALGTLRLSPNNERVIYFQEGDLALPHPSPNAQRVGTVLEWVLSARLK
jgi:DNA-binding XRE family transcriptional regulator